MAVFAKGLAARLATGRAGAGMIAMRGLEVTGALLVVLVGVLLITGLMMSERMFPV
jgi:ABC-type nickel/cobalt efflux system permease component RcnA